MMLRQIVLDTETTGLDPNQGHRLIEIGCIEIINRRVTQNHFHHYLQPDRAIDPGAQQVHGITSDFLADKPRFEEIAEQFLAYIDGAELIIHNAPFDLGFLNAEFKRMKRQWQLIQERWTIIDTLQMAREKHRGQKNSLDALCKRYSIDNSQRTLHGALLDSQLLAELYLAMTGGQFALFDEVQNSTTTHIEQISSKQEPLPVHHVETTIIQANEAERIAHQEWLERLKEGDTPSLWQRIEES